MSVVNLVAHWVAQSAALWVATTVVPMVERSVHRMAESMAGNLVDKSVAWTADLKAETKVAR